MNIEVELEEDGRWIAEVPDLPGVMAYGQNQKDAISKSDSRALWEDNGNNKGFNNSTIKTMKIIKTIRQKCYY